MITCGSDLTCRVSEKLLDQFINGVTTHPCQVGECVDRYQTANSFLVGDFTQIDRLSPSQKGSIILGSLYITSMLFIIAVSLVTCWRFSPYRSFMSSKTRPDCVNKDLANWDDSDGGFKLVWQNMMYQVKGREILRGVTGMSLPGELTAIMGPSGSGKTTLLDLLALKPKIGKRTSCKLI